MEGCDCTATELTCTQGYPVCLGAVIISPHTGPLVVTISSKVGIMYLTDSKHCEILQRF